MTDTFTQIDHLINISEENQTGWVTNPKEQHIGLQLLLEISERLIEQLSLEMNNIHACNLSTKYWRIMLGPWLMQWLAVAYDRFRLVDAVEHKIDRDKIYFSKLKRIVPKNTYESLKLVETNQFNSQILYDIYLFKKILTSKDPLIYTKRDSPLDDHCFDTAPVFCDNNNVKKQILNNLAKLAMSKNSIGVTLSAMPLKFQIKLSIRGVRKLIPIYPYIDGIENYNHLINNEFRQAALHLDYRDGDNTFLDFVNINIKKYLPVCFVEGYETLRSLSKRYGTAPSALIVGTEMYSRCESFMHWAAMNSLNETKLFSMQHGGNYGMEFRSEKTFIEINSYDKFYTWGWNWHQFKNNDSKKLKPMPSIFLHDKKSYKNSDKKIEILYTVTSIKSKVRRFDCSAVNPYTNERYFADQMKFYAALTELNKNNVHVRLYKDDLKNNYLGRWKKQFPTVKFDNDGNFNKSLHEAKLYVGDCLQTTWIEALSINKPFVLFVSPNLYDFTPEFEELTTKLISIEALHYSPESAAHFINDNYFKLSKWWRSNAVQATISEVREQLAWKSSNSTKLWIKELSSIHTSNRTVKRA